SPAEMYKGIGEKTSQILVAAEEAGEEIKTAAQQEAAQVLADSRMEASAIARQSQTERREAEDEIRKLRDARNLLKTQLEDVGRRLDEMISRLDSPLAVAGLDEAVPEEPAPPPPPPAAPPPLPEPRAEPLPEPRAEPLPEPRAEARPEPTPQPRPEPAPPPPAEPKPVEPTPTAPQPKVERMPEPVGTAPSAETGTLTQLKELLDEVRKEREAARHEIEAVISGPSPALTKSSAPTIVESAPQLESEAPQLERVELEEAIEVPPEISRRTGLLGDLEVTTASKLKRALQEDQNALLDRLRTAKKGTFDETFAPFDEQRGRFVQFLSEPLEAAYRAGREAGGASGGEASGPVGAVGDLIAKQLVTPLRKEVSRIVDSGIEAQDTSSSISDRAGDVYRVWKGVRTELLGEGMSYAAFHLGLIEAWHGSGRAQKVWIVSGDEIDCPRSVCQTNASSGPVDLSTAFPSGHQVPPAHGGCTCTLGQGGEGPE
ncbi:MAG: DivIVA domain-containing protein, partial [Acidimicrobiia bacterium]